MSIQAEVKDILAQIEAPSAVRQRVRRLLQYYDRLGYADYDVFVSETVDDDGLRHFYSLWLFNREASMEALLTEADDDQIDGARVRTRLVRWAARSRNYDYRRAGPDSRLSVEMWYSDQLYGGLEASGDNCDRLRDIMRTYLIPATGGPSAQVGTDQEGED